MSDESNPRVETTGRDERRSYLIGYALAMVLTLAAFGIVAWPDLASRQVALWSIGALAVVQIVVHVRFFLHVGWRQKREDLQLLLFSTLLLTLMVGGTIWIMLNLHGRMAPDISALPRPDFFLRTQLEKS